MDNIIHEYLAFYEDACGSPLDMEFAMNVSVCPLIKIITSDCYRISAYTRIRLVTYMSHSHTIKSISNDCGCFIEILSFSGDDTTT